MWGLASLLTLLACGRHRDEIRQLDAALTRLDSCQAVLDSLPLDSIQATRDWAGSQWNDFSLFANDSLMELSREEGMVIAEVGRVRRLLKDFPSRSKSLSEAIALSRTQITGLRTALEEGATQDRNGQPMHAEYIAAQVSTELGFVDRIATSCRETQLYSAQAMAARDSLMPIVDSTGQVLRARLAQRLISESLQSSMSTYPPR
jgi:hypothetical protein